MPDPQTNFFDTFTGDESDRMETIIAELGSAPWAQGILHGVEQNGGLVGKNMARFFELRFGLALHEAGIAVEYEVPGEGDSTLDFGFTSKGQPWKVEMMRLLETQAAKTATKTAIDEDGVRWTSRVLSSNNENKKQSTEGETLQVIQRICQKCERRGKPHKFPKPSNALHAILVDMRRFKDGGDVHDRLHIGLGSRNLYGKIVEQLKLAGQPVPDETDQSAAEQPAPGLPATWDDIAVGHLVIARDSTVDDGWWEAIVVARDGDMLTLKWRDYPLQANAVQHAGAVALLKPGPVST